MYRPAACREGRIAIVTGTTPAARVFAERLCALRQADLADPVRERVLELILDHVAVTVGGSEHGSTLAVNDAVRRLATSGTATMITTGARTNPAWAALANGTAAHAIEMDDCTRASSLHPGAAVIPAALAQAEEHDADVATLVAAVVAGYEVIMRVGAALGPESTYRRGFHPTGVAGALGAAMAAARVLGLDAERMTHALGIAGTMASGSLEYLADGSWTKRLNPGWAAHAGIVAAELAAAGYTGPATVIEGRLGLLHAHSDAAQPRLLREGLGEEHEIMKVAIKPYGCCRYAHGLVDCMLAVRAKRLLRADEIRSVELGVLSVGSVLIAEPIERKRDPRTVVDAQFSAPFAAAVALLHGDASLASFTAERLADPAVRSVMARTTCVRDPSLDAAYPAALPATARIVLNDGTVLTEHVEYPLGEPEHPLTRGQLLARFMTLVAARSGADAARRFARTVLDDDGSGRVRSLTAALPRAQEAHSTGVTR